jgi:hypothetical protein
MRIFLLFLTTYIGFFIEVSAQLDSSKILDGNNPIKFNLDFFSADKSIPQATLSESELNLLNEGDFLLRKGYGWISDRIADLLNEEVRITHCGLILTKGYAEPHVLHSISNDKINGVFVEPLRSFLKESQQGSLIAVRIKESGNKTEEMVFESKRILAKKIPFDLAFNDADTSSFYCAELFGYVFKNIWQRDLLPEKFNLFGMKAIRMRNFLNPSEFEVLFNQFEY